MAVGAADTAGPGVLVWTLIILGLVVFSAAVVALLMRPSAGGRKQTGGRNEDWAAEDVLRMRYARGELNGDDFRRRMQDLHEL